MGGGWEVVLNSKIFKYRKEVWYAEKYGSDVSQ